jgi:carbamoyl-phosphate synthase large subunit
MPWFSVKEAVLPFARFPGVDTLLGPEMRSTGEVMGWDRTFPRAFLKAQMGAGTTSAGRGHGVHLDQGRRQDAACWSRPRGCWSTSASPPGHPRHGGLPRRARDRLDVVNKVYEGGRTVVDIMKDGGVQLVLNTTEGAQAVEDSREIRAVALYDKIPYYTTLAASHAAAQAMKAAPNERSTRPPKRQPAGTGRRSPCAFGAHRAGCAPDMPLLPINRYSTVSSQMRMSPSLPKGSQFKPHS